MSPILYNQNRELLLKFALGEDISSLAIKWACDLLVEGEDTQHLRSLAGYTENEVEGNLEEFRSDFLATLRELNLEIPPQREAFSDFACYICNSYLDGLLSCDRAHGILYQIWMDINYDPKRRIDDRFTVWVYLSDSVSLIADGYGPLLKRFEGLNKDNFEEYFRREAIEFLNCYATH